MVIDMLSGLVVVIVGGGGLLGRCFVRSILQEGAFVVVTDVDVQRAESVVREMKDSYGFEKATSEYLDITSKESICSIIETIADKYGKIDCVVNNAYPRNKNYGRKLEDVTYADFCDNVGMHLGGYFLVCQQFSGFFLNQGYGNIVNISSIYGLVAPRFDIYKDVNFTMPVEYAAIKSAIQHLSVYFMRYFKGARIRFNCILPGGIYDGQPKEFVDRYSQYGQSKGMLSPSDVCGALVFLISSKSEFINGQLIVVDDGWSV